MNRCIYHKAVIPALLWTIILILGACSDDETAPAPVVLTPIDQYTGIDEKTQTIYVTDLPGSIGNTYASGHTPVFFSLDNHAIINPYDADNNLLTLPEDQARTNAWDIAFTGIYNSYITFNSATAEGTPGFGGTGQGALTLVDAPFDEVDEAPADGAFESFMADQTSVGWEDFPVGTKGWYFYSLESHIMSAIAGVTLVVRTADGLYAKIEMKTLYLGNPDNPTVNTPTPYFTFRYFLQTDGSRNLSTRITHE